MKKAIDLEYNNSEFWHIYADILSKQGFYDNAVAAYYKVIEMDEENEDVWLDIAQSALIHENMEKAISLLFEGIEKQPSNYSLRARLTCFYLQLGQLNQASEQLISTLTNEPDLID
ncbi:MAG: hypothetical protein COY57_01645, partial [Flavobacteriales bacterium CG_4_10_14_0_8_um_filter_32_5]